MMLGFTRNTLLLPLFSLPFLLQPLANAQSQAQGRPKVYSCPKDNGVKYTAPNGVIFELKCGQGTTAQRIDNTPKNSQKECADWCSEHPQCQSADYNADIKNCARFSEYIPTIAMAGVNTWFPIEERGKPQPEKEERSPPDCPKPNPALVETENFVAAGSGAECPDNNGKIFVTIGGTYYQIKCNTLSTTEVEITKRPMHDFADCMSACGEVPGCTSVTFSAGKPNWDCKFFGTGVSASAADPNNKMGFAYAIEPPTSAKPDDQVLLCATECPMADGQTWEAPNGQKYHMDCCKRHGITVISSDVTPSLTTCMSACSMINGCTSVDWHQDTGMCYWGKHSGEPTILVAGWASAHSLGCAGACKKQGSGGCGCGKSEL